MDRAAEQWDLARRFAGTARLYGDAALASFAAARTVVVGLGGVGSWAAEALARSGVGHITLVDLDHVAESNTNRQIHALGNAYGRAKVEAMAERIAAIHPGCDVRPLDEFATTDNAARLVGGADLVLDCIDHVRAKAALIAAGRALRVTVVTCGAAGGRTDPTRVAVGDLGAIVGDPLLARVRHRLRREHGYPAAAGKRLTRFGVVAVYSDEPLLRPAAVCIEEGIRQPGAALACAGYGSSVTVTATMGFVAAAQALDVLARSARERA